VKIWIIDQEVKCFIIWYLTKTSIINKLFCFTARRVIYLFDFYLHDCFSRYAWDDYRKRSAPACLRRAHWSLSAHFSGSHHNIKHFHLKHVRGEQPTSYFHQLGSAALQYDEQRRFTSLTDKCIEDIMAYLAYNRYFLQLFKVDRRDR